MITGIGVDIIEIDRIENSLKRFGASFLQRIFTTGEREYCLSKGDPAPHLAARFAAKEACVKAMGTGFSGFGFQELEVLVEESGRPRLLLRERARSRQLQLGISDFLLSLSHSRDYAVAQVLALGQSQKEDQDGDCQC